MVVMVKMGSVGVILRSRLCHDCGVTVRTIETVARPVGEKNKKFLT